MKRDSRSKHRASVREGRLRGQKPRRVFIVGGVLTVAVAIIIMVVSRQERRVQMPMRDTTSGAAVASRYEPQDVWMQRAYAINALYLRVYTPGWEGAYGAIGNAFMFAATGDSSLLRFHTVERSLLRLDNGYWVDDRAWACLAELKWWEVSGRWNTELVRDAARRYTQARAEGRLSHHEGYWSWYNWPPRARVNEPIFTNTNMNQMVTVACLLYEATGEKTYLDDALLVWNGDASYPGVEKVLYKGNGRWEGRHGRAAFGKELPWHGTGYCAIGAALYRVTQEEKYKRIVVATAKRIMDPAMGWVDPVDFYQVHMDGNGAFVNFLIDAYLIAPDELADLPMKIERMLEHVWTNAHGRAKVVLHRESDHGIRNGWNPLGGEDGYRVGDVGTIHAQAEAVRAFGAFAFIKHRMGQ